MSVARDDLLRFLGLQPGYALEAIREFFAVSEAEARSELEILAAEGLARQTARGTCVLTEAGRAARAELYGAEARVNSAGSALHSAYAAFEPVNKRFLAWATAWQTEREDGQEGALLQSLDAIDREIQALLPQAADSAPRFRYHQRALSAALVRVQAGELEFLLSPLTPSYHTSWFRLHQDWLEALGKSRE